MFGAPEAAGRRGERERVKDYPPPPPLPAYFETKKSAFPDKARKHAGGVPMDKTRGGDEASRIDALLTQATWILDGDQARVRNQQVERSVGIHRRRMQDRNNYLASKEQMLTPAPSMMVLAAAHKGAAPLKSLDDWLGQAGGPRLQGRNARELEQSPSAESYFSRQMESASQYDSEMRANLMARNSKKLRSVEEKLDELYSQSTAGDIELPRTSKSFPVDEVLAKLTPEALELVHEKFKALGSSTNLVEFVEVVSAHMPRQDWENHACMVNNLCEVYDRLDIDGDGIVTWDEVFEFTMEMGHASSKAAEKLADVILDYKPADVADRRGELAADRTGGVKDCEVERIRSLALMDRVAVIERDSAVIKLYDAETLELTDCLIGHKGPVMRCLHLEGTDYIVSSGTDTCLVFWGAYTNTLRQVLPCREVFMALVWDAVHHVLYAGGTSGHVYCFRVPDQQSATTTRAIQEIDRFSGHKDVITDMLAVNKLGLLITASMDSYIKIWDLAGHELKRQLQGHAKGVYTLGYIPSQRYLISAGFGNTCKVWNPMIEEPLFTLKGHNNTIAGLNVIMGSNRIITADIDGFVKVWDIRNFRCVQTISVEKAEPGSVTAITYVDRLDRIVLTCVGLSTRRVHRMFCIDYEHSSAPEFAEEGPLVTALVSIANNAIITASMRTVRLWDACTGLLKKSFGDMTKENITAMCFDSREQRLIVGDESGGIGVYNSSNGALLKTLDAHEEDVSALAYCPYSKCILSASWGGRIRIHHDHEPQSTKILRQIDGHATAISCMAYSVKLCTIATSSTAGSVRLWDFQDIKLTATLQAHTTEVTLLHWIDEYRALLTADFLGNLILWTVAPWRDKYKPICRWEFIVKMDDEDQGKVRGKSALSTVSVARRSKAVLSPAAPEIQEKLPASAKRDTPTCCAFDAKSHTIFIGGTSGEIVAYDLKAIKGALLEWMGVDESGKKPGSFVPPIAPRVFVRNPRQGCTQVPEQKGDDLLMIDSLIKSSGHVSFDISTCLEMGRDITTGLPLTPRLHPDVVRRKYAWTAHEDSIKSIQLIEVLPTNHHLSLSLSLSLALSLSLSLSLSLFLSLSLSLSPVSLSLTHTHIHTNTHTLESI